MLLLLIHVLGISNPEMKYKRHILLKLTCSSDNKKNNTLQCMPSGIWNSNDSNTQGTYTLDILSFHQIQFTLKENVQERVKILKDEAEKNKIKVEKTVILLKSVLNKQFDQLNLELKSLSETYSEELKNIIKQIKSLHGSILNEKENSNKNFLEIKSIIPKIKLTSLEMFAWAFIPGGFWFGIHVLYIYLKTEHRSQINRPSQ